MIYRLIISVILFLVAVVMMVMTSFVIYPFCFEFLIILFSIVGLLFLVFFYDLPLLALSSATVSTATQLNNLIKNLSCRMGIREVKFYISSRFAHNIYILHPIGRKPVIIFGSEVLSKLSDLEMEVILQDILTNIKNRNVQYRTIVLSFTMLWMIPLLLFSKKSTDKFSYRAVLGLLYFIPMAIVLRFVRSNFFSSGKDFSYHKFYSEAISERPFKVVLFDEFSYVKIEQYNIWDSLLSVNSSLRQRTVR